VGAIDAAALGPFKIGHGREKEMSSLLWFNFPGCYNFGKIIKTVATRCHILKLKCTRFDFVWGSAPSVPLGLLTTIPWSLGFKRPRPTSEGKEGKERA